ncbi:hypothetical protein B0A81_04095 [Flavobacterium plurextorum]|uniref:MBL fold metallo-hydrolase n=1 Tax=Flavobacterium plurextorum TaxID=1114867 RepID=A0ABX4CXV6_9FLAO|nr:hypothetical protein [Flavobacterium plurextorum]OXB10197.1 hypothetical protein B0A81_04095 [Flavobacterium plurextorum]
MKETKMKIYFYQAECGDASRINYKGDDNQNHNIFIDSGYERTFNHILSKEIEKLITNKEIIDMWLISHIHDDHIGGVIKYLTTIKRGEFTDIVEEWYYNPPRIYPALKVISDEKKISEIKSIDQGDQLYNYLNQKGKIKNFDITSEITLPLIFGMEFKVLTPSVEKINKLREKYRLPIVPLQKNESSEISEAKKPKEYDYNVRLDDFDLDFWDEDTSVENGSSISVLTIFEGKKILWLADSHPSDIVRSLKTMGYSKNNKIKCNLVKVTHHGSKANNSNELYDLIDCENYLMSVNGINKDYLPTKESMARIIRNKNRSINSHYKFYFTYDNKILRGIFKSDEESVFEKWNFDVHYLTEGEYYEFEL